MVEDQSLRELRRYAAAIINAETESSSHSDVPAAAFAPSRRQLRFPARVGLAAAVLVAGNIGLAVASDSAIPGDLLYPVDRGYEAVANTIGIDTGESQERIDEAYLLLAHGEIDAAVAVAAEALPNAAPEQQQALDDLAAELGPHVSDTSTQVHEAVAGLLNAVNRVSQDPAAESGRGPDTSEVQEQARAVAEAARGRPFDPEQGPGTGGGNPHDGDESPADNPNASNGNPAGGKGRVDNPGQGNANRETNGSAGAGNGTNSNSQGQANGRNSD